MVKNKDIKQDKKGKDGHGKIRKLSIIQFYGMSYVCSILILVIGNSRYAISQDHIFFKWDTTHYFFSAVFQGFSAIFGVLIVAIIFFIDKIDHNIAESERVILYKFYMMTGVEYPSYTKFEDKIYKDTKKFNKSDKAKIRNCIKEWERLKSIISSVKKYITFSLFSIIVVIIISLIFLTQCSWIIANNIFWNIFSVSFTVCISIVTLALLVFNIRNLMLADVTFADITPTGITSSNSHFRQKNKRK